MELENQCRLCLGPAKSCINIFDSNGQTLNIRSILTKHFWFEVKEDERLPQIICTECWEITCTFNSLYCKVEVAQKLFTDKAIKEGIGVGSETEETVQLVESEVICAEDIKQEQLIFIEELKVERSSDEDARLILDESVIELDSSENRPTRRLKRTQRNEPIAKSTSSKIKRPKVSHSLREKSEEKTLEDIEEEAREKKERDQKRHEEDALISEYFPMACEICEIKFINFGDTRSHYRKVHQKAGYLACCSKRFFYRGGLLDHISVHLNPDIFKCQICEKTFGNKFALGDHMELKHLPQENKMYPCDKCDRRFAKQYRLKQHIEISHIEEETKKERLICDNCGRTFSSKASILVHIRDVHLRNFLKMCEICAKTFNCKKSFKAHCLLHSGQPRMQCNVCGRWLKTKDSLRSHLRRHSDTQHTCQYCSKVTPNRQALANHILYVHGERSHKCTLCNKAFKVALGLKEHMASHTGQSLYTCPYCPRTFNSNGNMHKHRKNTHSEEWKKDRGKRMKDLYSPNS